MKTEAQELILEAHEKGTKITKSILEKSFPELFKQLDKILNKEQKQYGGLKSIPENIDFSKIKKVGEMFKYCEPKTIEQRLELIEQFINELKNK